MSLKGKNVQNYWLNKDGSVTSKSSWIGRLIRWIQNLFYDKTLSDIWHVFNRAVEEFEASQSDMGLYCFDTAAYVGSSHLVRRRLRHVHLAVQFLSSRKNKFHKRFKRNPEQLKQVEERIHGLWIIHKQLGDINTIASLPETKAVELKNFCKGLLNETRQYLQLVVRSLENVYYPPVSMEAMSRKPPPLKMVITPEADPKGYQALDLNSLKDCYDAIPLGKKETKLFKTLKNFFSEESAAADEIFHSAILKVFSQEQIPFEEASGDFNFLKAFCSEMSAPMPGETPAVLDLAKFLGLLVKGVMGLVPDIKSKDRQAISFQIVKEALRDLSQKMEGKPEFLHLYHVAERRGNLSRFIHSVKTRDNTVFGVNKSIHEKYYDQIELFLKNILHVIKNDPKVSPKKQENILGELAIASGECGARWLEESKKQYRSLTCYHSSEAEVKVLEHIQALKEDLFLELFQKSQKLEYHILDTFRMAFGGELGLDDSTVDLDLFTYKIKKAGLQELKKHFLRSLTSSTLVRGVTERINFELQQAFEPAYFTYLSESLEKRYPGLDDPSDYVMKHFMGSDYKSINEKGALFLLQEMKFLAS